MLTESPRMKEPPSRLTGPPLGLSLPGRPKPYVMAHRGNRVACPENTLAAFRRALADGADLLETDLWLSTDGELVCIHDPTVDRTTDGTGRVEEKSVRELKTLSASCGRAEFAAERVPTLEEVVALVPPGRGLVLELKSDRFLEPAVARQLAARLDALPAGARAAVISFSLARVRSVKAAMPELPIGWIPPLSALRPVPGVDLIGPFWPVLLANPLYAFQAHRQGQVVCPLDTTPDGRLAYYEAIGCDAVLTDDPAATVRARSRKRR